MGRAAGLPASDIDALAAFEADPERWSTLSATVDRATRAAATASGNDRKVLNPLPR